MAGKIAKCQREVARPLPRRRRATSAARHFVRKMSAQLWLDERGR